jgi:acyl-CoA synthetase (AMP-forming)/AMP-acid ligase II
MSADRTARPARATWMGGSVLSDSQRQELIGPGAPFEMVVEPVLGTDMTVFRHRAPNLRAHFDQVTAGRADRPFLVDGDSTWTYGEATVLIDAVAALLTNEYGVGPGDRVGVVSANSPGYAIVMWATVSIGAVVAGLNGWWAGPELAYGLELAQPKVIVGDQPRLSRIPTGVVAAGVPVLAMDELLSQAEGHPSAPRLRIGEDDPAVILFTSGTTGRPKGAALSHRNILHLASSAQLGRAMGAALAGTDSGHQARQPASILSSPMFHVSGMAGVLGSGPTTGSKLVFPPAGRWDPLVHLEMTAAHGISSWSGVPTQYFRMFHHPDFASFDLRGLRSATSGGAPFAPELVHEFQTRLPWVVLANGYGMTESAGIGTLNTGALILDNPESVGAPHPGVEVEIRDAAGEVIPEGAVGEIALRSASVFLGYWGDPEADEAVFAPGRWYRTGDFGRIDRGFLYLESRMRDLIIRGGENVYPIEIENRIVEHPDVADAAVVGVDHPDLGQEVKAFVVPRDGAEVTPEVVQAWVAETLARFKVPAHVELIDELPYTDSGKVIKAELERRDRPE